MRSAASAAPAQDLAGIQTAVERFIQSARQPSILEPGDELLDIAPDSYALDRQPHRLTLNVWTDTRNLVRRVTGLAATRPGRIELIVERFGKKEGRLWLLDRARPDTEDVARKGKRLMFRERFRRFLTRQFTGWKLAELSSEANLQQSLSPAYPRALLRKGATAIAAIGASHDAAGALSFGLLWLDYLRRRDRKLAVERLVIYVPAGDEAQVCQRLRWLNQAAARYEVYAFTEVDSAQRMDVRDIGNLDTRLDTLRRPPVEVKQWVERLAALPSVEQVAMNDGSVSLRTRGLEFARTAGCDLLFGLHQRIAAREHNLPEIEQLAADLARFRRQREHPLHWTYPEAWLEAQVRRSIETIDASLLPAPIYTHVPACLGGQRGIIDLLAVDREGRLTLVELKASADLHLPLQALDYWMRVRWHLDRGEFTSRGYFPGITLHAARPRVLLVSPALEFHPSTETILRFLSPEIEIERIGVNATWRDELAVMFRATGSSTPDAASPTSTVP